MMKLGIDFGTSYSYFAVQLDDEDHTIIQLGENTLAGDYLKKKTINIDCLIHGRVFGHVLA